MDVRSILRNEVKISCLPRRVPIGFCCECEGEGFVVGKNVKRMALNKMLKKCLMESRWLTIHSRTNCTVFPIAIALERYVIGHR